MVGNHIKMKRLWVWIFLSLMGCVIAVTVNCGSGGKKSNEIPFKKNKVVYTKWDQVFEKSEIIPLRFQDPNMEIYTIGGVEINSKGQYIICDPKNEPNSISLFDSTGLFLKYIGRIGEAGGEYLIPTCSCFDSRDNYYLFDIARKIVIKYSAPDYTFEKQIRMQSYFDRIIMDPYGNFISYRRNADSRKIFFKYSADGKLLKSIFTPDDEDLHLFLARFGLGGIEEIPGEGILGLYPAEYKIFFFDYDLNLKKTISAPESSTYQPSIGRFPKTLSPYSYSKQHAKWWGKELRPGAIFYLGSGLFIIELDKYDNMSEKFYINIHDLEGNTYAEGLEVPFDSIIRFVKNGYVYVVEDSTIDDTGNVLPLKLHRFKIKDLRKM
jgi:hypothetical protein